MSIFEKLWRAAAALVAGASIAAEHLRDDIPEAEVVEIPAVHCPECGGSLIAGPHFHDDRGYWSCGDDLGVLVTDNHGGLLR